MSKLTVLHNGQVKEVTRYSVMLETFYFEDGDAPKKEVTPLTGGPIVGMACEMTPELLEKLVELNDYSTKNGEPYSESMGDYVKNGYPAWSPDGLAVINEAFKDKHIEVSPEQMLAWC